MTEHEQDIVRGFPKIDIFSLSGDSVTQAVADSLLEVLKEAKEEYLTPKENDFDFIDY